MQNTVSKSNAVDYRASLAALGLEEEWLINIRERILNAFFHA